MTTEVKLADVCDIRSGGTPSRGKKEYYGGTIPWAKIGDLERSDSVVETEEYLSEAGLRAIGGRIFPKGTLLFAIYGSMGKMAFAGTELSTNQAILGIQLLAGDRIDLKYLFHYLSQRLVEMKDAGRGVTQKNLSATYLRELKVPLPRIDEQRRIAAILDTADGIRRKRERAVAVANEFLKSTFLHMFGDVELNPLGWKTLRMGELLEVDPQNGLYRPSQDYGSGTSILRIDGFYDGYLVKNRPLKRLRLDSGTIAKYRLQNGDIVVNRVNSREYLGKSALIERLKDDTVFESNIMRFRVYEKQLNPRFLVDQLQTPFVRRQIARAAKDAVNQSSINQKDVRGLEIRVPPVELQETYARIVSNKVRADERLSEALKTAEELSWSLSQRAFRSEL
jgi:type I restriction enzyme S subunit